MTEKKGASKRQPIAMEREEGTRFAVFTNGQYTLRVDAAFRVREKVGVIAEAFVQKGGCAEFNEAAQEVRDAINAVEPEG